MQSVTLRNGVKMPQIGFGVYQIDSSICERCVLDALEIGYRHIDTAQAYFNEDEVGLALQHSLVDRKDIFLTTKVWLGEYGKDKTKASIDRSLKKLKTDYLDLVLLHQPFADVYSAWRDLEDYYEQGLIRAIGISNFYSDRMVDLCNFSRIAPMVNQVETHPRYQQIVAQKWMEKYGVQIESWAPFGEGRGGLFADEILTKIANKHNRTTAQIMLRWQIQRGIVIIPKSIRRERMQENFNIFDFELDDVDMKLIELMDTPTRLFTPHNEPETVEKFVKIAEQRK